MTRTREQVLADLFEDLLRRHYQRTGTASDEVVCRCGWSADIVRAVPRTRDSQDGPTALHRRHVAAVIVEVLP